METKITEAIYSPKELEILYRKNPDEFSRAFPSVYLSHPESTILQVWQERLSYKTENGEKQIISTWSFKNILFIVLSIAFAGTMYKISESNERAFSFIFIVPLIIYFVQRTELPKFRGIVLLVTVGSLIYLDLLPNYHSYNFSETYGTFRDALKNVDLLIPLFLWLVTGVAFGGKEWKITSTRMQFLRYDGEVIIYTTILIIGGLILTFITMGLLNFIENTYELTSWYEDYVIIYLFVSTPIVATFLLDKIIDKRLNIAPTIAKFFTPLFLITITAYLIIMAIYQKNPFNDRNYLTTLNSLLIVVLGLLIFTIAERNNTSKITINDYLNIGLAFVTIILNSITLSASIFRTASDIYGLTPNRITILGINFLVFIHLLGILFNYVRFVWKSNPFEKLENWIAGYLSYYAIWAILVSVLLPIIFWYK